MALSKKAQAAMSTVVDKIKAGDLSQVVQAALITRHPDDNCPGMGRSLNNRFLSLVQRGTIDTRTYNQWQAVGRQVQKGEKAAYIIGPIMVPLKDKDGNILKNADGKPRLHMVNVKGIPVFSADQTEGEELPTFDYEPAEMPPLAELAERFGVSVAYAPAKGNWSGSTKVDGSAIELNTHDVRTWFHELAHAVQARLQGKLKGGQDAKEETIAEFTSCVLMWLYGLGDRTGNAWAYIQHYNKDPVQAIGNAMQDVETILEALQV